MAANACNAKRDEEPASEREHGRNMMKDLDALEQQWSAAMVTDLDTAGIMIGQPSHSLPADTEQGPRNNNAASSIEHERIHPDVQTENVPAFAAAQDHKPC